MSAKVTRSSGNFNSERVDGLLSRIDDYERYFELFESGKKDDDGEGQDKVERYRKLDHAATTAYINLVKLVCSLSENEPDDANPEDNARAARKIFKEEFGVEL